jgi:predicted DNA-binding transcriptional regulator AlpA
MAPLLHTKQAEYLLGLAPNTLASWRYKGTPNQPPYITMGKNAVRYRQEDLDEWLDSRAVHPRNGGAA